MYIYANKERKKRKRSHILTQIAVAAECITFERHVFRHYTHLYDAKWPDIQCFFIDLRFIVKFTSRMHNIRYICLTLFLFFGGCSSKHELPHLLMSTFGVRSTE